MNKAISYARVSSKEQEKEGFSIPAQQKLISEYSLAKHFQIIREFVDVETAKQSGRTSFGEMICFLKAQKEIRTILVEKTDRLYRNLRDWVTLDDLGVEIHFVKENVIFSGESKSMEKFVHGIKVLMAKNYVDNLSEETKKGQIQKAESGLYPSRAPIGYINAEGVGGKKIIIPDPVYSPKIQKIFNVYATGFVSLKQLAFDLQRSGRRLKGTNYIVVISFGKVNCTWVFMNLL
jgi:DNA invertase Pin-like site-specific DNA recombinase